MKILITGGSGFIGTNLVEYYLSKREDMLNLDISSPKNATHKPYWRKVDILDVEALRLEIVNFSPSHIINLAAQTGTTDRGRKLEDYATNFRGLRNLIDIARDTPSVERLISTSSMIVCKAGYQPQSDADYCPDTLYGQSKVLGERLLREAKGLPYSWVIVRPTGIWGPWFGVPYRNLFEMISKGLYVHPGHSDVTQSLGFVGNTVCQLDRLTRASPDKVHGKTFYLADYPPTNMRRLVDLIQKAFRTRKTREVPLWALKVVAKAGDIMKRLGWDLPPLSSSRLENMLTSFVFDLDPIMTHDLPHGLEEAVRVTVDWMRESKT